MNSVTDNKITFELYNGSRPQCQPAVPVVVGVVVVVVVAVVVLVGLALVVLVAVGGGALSSEQSTGTDVKRTLQVVYKLAWIKSTDGKLY